VSMLVSGPPYLSTIKASPNVSTQNYFKPQAPCMTGLTFFSQTCTLNICSLYRLCYKAQGSLQKGSTDCRSPWHWQNQHRTHHCSVSCLVVVGMRSTRTTHHCPASCLVAVSGSCLIVVLVSCLVVVGMSSTRTTEHRSVCCLVVVGMRSTRTSTGKTSTVHIIARGFAWLLLVEGKPELAPAKPAPHTSMLSELLGCW